MVEREAVSVQRKSERMVKSVWYVVPLTLCDRAFYMLFIAPLSGGACCLCVARTTRTDPSNKAARFDILIESNPSI